MRKLKFLLFTCCIFSINNFVLSQNLQERQSTEEDALQTYEELKNMDISDIIDQDDVHEIDLSPAREMNEEDLEKFIDKYSNRENSRNYKELRSANDKSKLWLQTVNNDSHQNLIKRFEDADVSSEELDRMNRTYEEFRANPTKKNYQNYLNTVSDFANKHDRWCNLTVVTIPNNGATIKYRLLEGNEAFTMGASQISKALRLGYYTIWSERNGKVTSSKNDICECIQETESFTIAENNE